MKNFYFPMFVFLCCCCVLQIQAAPAEEPQVQQSTPADPPKAENSVEKTAQDVEPLATKSTQKTKRPLDIFQPSEEISEDFAVSFPVDI